MANIVRDLIEYSGLTGEIPDLASPGCFKQFSLQQNLSLPKGTPLMEKIVKVHARVNIKSTKVIATPSAVSLAGQILTGMALAVEGEAVQKIEYTACGPACSLQQSIFTMPFTASMVLPAGFKTGSPVAVRTYIENSHIELLDNSTVFTSTDILLAAEL